MVYNIPNGPKNLSVIFPTVDFSKVLSYYIRVIAEDESVIATSPLNFVETCEDYITIHFVNQLGSNDSIPLRLINADTDSKSETIQIPSTGNKSTHGINRFNIKYNHIYKAEVALSEEAAQWIMELFGSPYAWLEWEGTQNQADDYIPIVLIDKRIQHRKDTERYQYIIEVDFSLSHEKLSPRA